MKNPFLYSIPEIFQLYNENKEEIQSYIQNNTIEHYSDSADDVAKTTTSALVVILIIGIISLILWVWALFITLKRWDRLSSTKQTLCIVLLILSWVALPIVSPIIVLLLAYTS